MIEDGRPSDGTRYDSIGLGYSQCRREDPVLYEKIIAALGSSQTVVNVGAGAGSYEPRDRTVLAVEPSEVMARQRSCDKLPAIKATADRLPFHDKSVDACMTVLSLHHWNPNQMAGVHEMRRIARDRIVCRCASVRSEVTGSGPETGGPTCCPPRPGTPRAEATRAKREPTHARCNEASDAAT